MNILYIGDVMAGAGMKVVEKVLPKLIKEKKIDLVIAQAENVTDGKGISLADYARLKKLGVDAFSSGNHIFDNKEILPALSDPNQPIVRPANYPPDTPGLKYKYLDIKGGKILIISLLGQIVGRNSNQQIDNPLKVVDKILESEKSNKKLATVVNFHGDYSSEKVVIGHYLDGRVTAVIGDHWHVPSVDARVLPSGTAHISDVGMCGALDSSLGVKYSSIVPRWRDGIITKNILEESGSKQFNAVLIDVDMANGLANHIEHIRKVFAS